MVRKKCSVKLTNPAWFLRTFHQLEYKLRSLLVDLLEVQNTPPCLTLQALFVYVYTIYTRLLKRLKVKIIWKKERVIQSSSKIKNRKRPFVITRWQVRCTFRDKWSQIILEIQHLSFHSVGWKGLPIETDDCLYSKNVKASDQFSRQQVCVRVTLFSVDELFSLMSINKAQIR